MGGRDEALGVLMSHREVISQGSSRIPGLCTD